jgi:hypothetical protein
VGCVVKWRTYLTSAAARVVRTVEMSHGDGSMRGLGCGRGAACYYFGKRGHQAIQNAITEVKWRRHLVKWRRHLTSAAARVVHAGGNGVEMVACMMLGVGGGGLFDIILERRDSKLFKMLSPRFWVGYLVK